MAPYTTFELVMFWFGLIAYTTAGAGALGLDAVWPPVDPGADPMGGDIGGESSDSALFMSGYDQQRVLADRGKGVLAACSLRREAGDIEERCGPALGHEPVVPADQRRPLHPRKPACDWV